MGASLTQIHKLQDELSTLKVKVRELVEAAHAIHLDYELMEANLYPDKAMEFFKALTAVKKLL